MAFQDYTESARARLHLGQVRPQALIGIALIAAALIGALIWGVAGLGAPGAFEVQSAEAEPAEQAADAETEAAAAPAVICVHVGGCVASPGMVELSEGARVADAVAAAGGLTADAAADAINLARVVQDGEQVLVPSAAEASAASTTAALGGADAGGTPASGAAASQGGKVNINTADAAQLQTLSGVGESKARKIIAYREQNGPFKSVEDLVNVSGIGEKTLDALRDSICV